MHTCSFLPFLVLWHFTFYQLKKHLPNKFTLDICSFDNDIFFFRLKLKNVHFQININQLKSILPPIWTKSQDQTFQLEKLNCQWLNWHDIDQLVCHVTFKNIKFNKIVFKKKLITKNIWICFLLEVTRGGGNFHRLIEEQFANQNEK